MRAHARASTTPISTFSRRWRPLSVDGVTGRRDFIIFLSSCFSGTKFADQTVLSPPPPLRRRRPAGNQKPTVAAPDGPEKCETSVTRDVWSSGRLVAGGWGEEEAMRTATSRGGRYPKIPRVPRRVASASSVVTDRRAAVASIFVPPHQ